MSSNAESSPDRLAGTDAAADGPDGGDATGPGGADAVDAADAAGIGDIRWATEVQAATGQRWQADGAAADNAGSEGHTSTGADAHGSGADPASAGTQVPDAGVGESTRADTEAGTESAATTGDDSGSGDAEPAISAEDLVQDLERVTAERDQYLDASRRLQAEFENYRKAVAKREVDARERANESLVSELLPVLDACDGALASGATDVEPVRTSLVDTLTKQGLTRIDDTDAPFDPERHEAVMHDPDADGSGDGPVVAEVMRAGYLWKGRVVRPAMVRVRG